MSTFAFRFLPSVARWNRLFGIRPRTTSVEVDDGTLTARFGPWIVRTPTANVADVVVTGPYRTWRVAGPARWSPTDHGLTFATDNEAGLCIRFVEPVPGLEPTGRVRSRSLTVTVEDPEGLGRELGGTDPIPHLDLSTGSIRAALRAVVRHTRRTNVVESEHRATADTGPPTVRRPVDAQPPESGVGPTFHRRYRANIVGSSMTAAELMAAISADPNAVSDPDLAPFVKDLGADGKMSVGDRFTVNTAGPWSGPVEVVAHDRRGFRFETLDGHMEAGAIEFHADDGDRGIAFEIESWARSGDRAFDLLYDSIGIAKAVQTELWVIVCERAAELAQGRIDGSIVVDSTRSSEPA